MPYGVYGKGNDEIIRTNLDTLVATDVHDGEWIEDEPPNY